MNNLTNLLILSMMTLDPNETDFKNGGGKKLGIKLMLELWNIQVYIW